MIRVVADGEDVRRQLADLPVLVLMYVLRRVDRQDLVRIDRDQYRPGVRLSRNHTTAVLFRVQPHVTANNNEKALRETQTLRAGCSKAEPKFSPRRRPTSRGHGTAKIQSAGDSH